MPSIPKLIAILLTIGLSQAFQLPTYRDNVSSTSTKSTVASSPTIDVKVREANRAPLVRRTKWGTDSNEREDEYWYDQRIHTLGNIGLSGAFHAALAPVSTKLIDVKAYDGIDVRAKLAQQLAGLVKAKNKVCNNPRVVDLCCGVGFSTRALQRAFPWAETIMGVDTSEEMIAMAKFITDHETTLSPYFARNLYHRLKENAKDACRRTQATFVKANAENTELPGEQFDLVTVMYAFHEAPRRGRDSILREARRLLKPQGTLAVVDISTEYKPSAAMLSGEPYVEDYQKEIHSQMRNAPGFDKPVYQNVIPNHLGMWVLRRTSPLALP